MDRINSWPEEDREELAELAREIEARRKGVYVLSDDERVAIEKARNSPLVPESEMKALWKRLGIG